MPTGYTAGILDGTIKDFKEFARLCARAFGATIHMRDEKLNREYEPRVPSDYNTEAIAKSKKQLELSETLSDEEVLKSEIDKLNKTKTYHLESVEKTKQNLKVLNEMLREAEAWTPPTSDHTGVKEFMIEQIKSTIGFDGSAKYHIEGLETIEKELSELTATKARSKMKIAAYKDIAYHTAEQEKELERCDKANKWVKDYFDSLENITDAQ